jgi:hypothetical protein
VKVTCTDRKSWPAISRKALIVAAITNSVFCQAKCLGRPTNVNFDAHILSGPGDI